MENFHKQYQNFRFLLIEISGQGKENISKCWRSTVEFEGPEGNRVPEDSTDFLELLSVPRHKCHWTKEQSRFSRHFLLAPRVTKILNPRVEGCNLATTWRNDRLGAFLGRKK